MKKFEELEINPLIIKSLEKLGFKEPTEIQANAIPVLLSGTKDFIGLAQTGTGKTAAFGIPLIQLLQNQPASPKALIVCPTRELCLQITKDLGNFTKFLTHIRIVAVYGGASIGLQIRDIKQGTHIIVATPGRLIDLIERKAIDLQNIKYVVLDEADEMLNMGFEEDIDFILKNTPKRDSMWLFSATMPIEIKKVTKKYMNTPHEITVGKKNTTNLSIDHQFYVCSAQHRYETLKRIIDFNPGIYGIIFTRTKMDAQEISARLTREGYDIDALHGDLSQSQRDNVMGEFRNKTLQLLIATDVAARGIDIDGITHVINFELPDDIEVYTHRSGRTGRAGKQGICISIIHSKELYKLRQIEKMNGAKFHKLDIPSGNDVCRKQFYHCMDKFLSTDISHGNFETYVPLLEEKFASISKEEILKRLVALEFNRFLKYYDNAADLNFRDRTNNKNEPYKKENNNRNSEHKSIQQNKNNFDKLYLNLGSKDGFYKAGLIQFILDLSDLPKSCLGIIDIKEFNSWIEIDKSFTSKMTRAIDGKNYKSRKIRMNIATDKIKNY